MSVDARRAGTIAANTPATIATTVNATGEPYCDSETLLGGVGEE